MNAPQNAVKYMKSQKRKRNKPKDGVISDGFDQKLLIQTI